MVHLLWFGFVMLSLGFMTGAVTIRVRHAELKKLKYESDKRVVSRYLRLEAAKIRLRRELKKSRDRMESHQVPSLLEFVARTPSPKRRKG